MGALVFYYTLYLNVNNEYEKTEVSSQEHTSVGTSLVVLLSSFVVSCVSQGALWRDTHSRKSSVRALSVGLC